MTTFGSPDLVRENAYELLELLGRYVDVDKVSEFAPPELYIEASNLISKIRKVP